MKAAILGTGSWASAFGRHLCHKWDRVVLWGIVESQVDEHQHHRHQPRLPGRPSCCRPTCAPPWTWTTACAGADVVFSVVPSQAVREVMAKVAASADPARRRARSSTWPRASRSAPWSACRQVIEEELAKAGRPDRHPVGVLLGPSHAEEVALELPTAVVLAGQPGGDWAHWQTWISGPFFRVYTNDDMAGVEIATGFKNIIALAVGMADGLGTGDNTRGTIMTRGMVELARLGCALGGRPETFFGLAGIGDMITTCISRHSRNRNFGEAVTKSGEDPRQLLAAPGPGGRGGVHGPGRLEAEREAGRRTSYYQTGSRCASWRFTAGDRRHDHHLHQPPQPQSQLRRGGDQERRGSARTAGPPGQVVEGVYMTQAALKLSEKLSIELPITKQVHDVLFSSKPPRQAMRELMERQLRAELD